LNQFRLFYGRLGIEVEAQDPVVGPTQAEVDDAMNHYRLFERSPDGIRDCQRRRIVWMRQYQVDGWQANYELQPPNSPLAGQAWWRQILPLAEQVEDADGTALLLAVEGSMQSSREGLRHLEGVDEPELRRGLEAEYRAYQILREVACRNVRILNFLNLLNPMSAEFDQALQAIIEPFRARLHATLTEVVVSLRGIIGPQEELDEGPQEEGAVGGAAAVPEGRKRKQSFDEPEGSDEEQEPEPGKEVKRAKLAHLAVGHRGPAV
jgi:hypothetical protein